ncbi:MAG: hypothetical protein C4K48_04375 [Candidatus Thorarchaeota archaeon]|nr:MAG: hypothetical protein C4K48_04375 [Candidatus Thorarchaeota archaeon]
MADSQDSFDNLDAFSEAANQTETKLIIIFVLEIMSGVFGIILTAVHLSMDLYPGPLGLLIMYVAHGVIIGALAVLSLIAGWGFWRLEPWAWRVAMAVGIASVIVHVLTLSPLILALNIILLWYLKNPQVREVYSGIESLWASESAETPQ